MSLLAFEQFAVRYEERVVLEGIDLTIGPGEIVALVGPSGAGKSTLALAALGLLPPTAQVSGTVRVDGHALPPGAAAWALIRGGLASLVFQDPAVALDPLMTIGAQVAEVIRLHHPASFRNARARAAAVLARVGLDPGTVPPSRYPHQLSGGQRQRVQIALAIAPGPRLLIADEPTAALDSVARGELVALLRGLVGASGMALLLISHDRALVAGLADRIVDIGPPRPGRTPVCARSSLPSGDRLIEATALTRTHAGRRVVDGASLTLDAGERLGLVGASGAGKSTLARLLVGLDRPDRGTIRWRGTPVGRRGWRRVQAEVGIVFQHPATAFDPRWPVGRIVAEPLGGSTASGPAVAAALAEVGLEPALVAHLPHQLSGGQRQRVAMARALIARPRLLVLDEALSALDPTAQDDMLRLLDALAGRHRFAILFIGHDLALVGRVADRLVVMEHGRVVEQGAINAVLRAPQHSATRALVAAAAI